jgi:hypothetical protein
MHDLDGQPEMPICVFMCPQKDEPGGKDWVENYIISVKLEFLSNFNERKTKILAGPYQNILNALFQVQPNFSSPVNKKIV